MSRYSFRCRDCGAEFEVRCAWAEVPAQCCPQCGSSEKERTFPSVQVNTSGASCFSACEGAAACPYHGHCGGN